MSKAKKTITVTMTTSEAHAILRAIGVANVSDRTDRADKNPNTWVALRIASALGLTLNDFIAEVKRA